MDIINATGEDDALVAGVEEEEEDMDEAMTMMAGELNDLSEDGNEDDVDDDDELLGGTTTTVEAEASPTTATRAVMDLPPLPPFPPLLQETAPIELGGSKLPPESTIITNANGGDSSKATYYAVRVGYAVCPSCSTSKNDGGSDQGGSCVSNGRHIISAVRSAIFLQWEDVKNFVEFTTATKPPSAHLPSTGEETGVPFLTDVEYKQFDDLQRAERYLKKVLPAFNSISSTSTTSAVSSSRDKSKSKSASAKLKLAVKKAMTHKTKIKSLLRLTPTKSFNPPTKKWQSMYDTALQYKAVHGNLDVPADEKDDNYAQYEDLSKWIKYQRTSYRYYLEDPMGGKHSMTEEKVNRLKAAGFAWVYADKKAWLEEDATASGEGGSGKKRGRPRKTAQMKMREDLAAAVAATAAINLTPKPIRLKWLTTYQKLKEYKERTGSIDIPEDETDEELATLRLWCKNQKNSHSRWKQGYDVGMTQEKANVSYCLQCKLWLEPFQLLKFTHI